MKKKLIKLTESDLHNIIKESVARILREEVDMGQIPAISDIQSHSNMPDDVRKQIRNLRHQIDKLDSEGKDTSHLTKKIKKLKSKYLKEDYTSMPDDYDAYVQPDDDLPENYDESLYDEWYEEEDYDGNVGEPGMVKSYDIGHYYLSQAEEDAEENGYDNVVDYLKYWFNEIEPECPWYWTKVNSNYQMQGNVLFKENNIICMEFADQILFYGDIDNSDFYNRLQSGEYWSK